jgi:hypothetical protein
VVSSSAGRRFFPPFSSIPITVLVPDLAPKAARVIAFAGEQRSLSQENADRFPRRIVIAFRGERVIGYGENPQSPSKRL